MWEFDIDERKIDYMDKIHWLHWYNISCHWAYREPDNKPFDEKEPYELQKIVVIYDDADAMAFKLKWA